MAPTHHTDKPKCYQIHFKCLTRPVTHQYKIMYRRVGEEKQSRDFGEMMCWQLCNFALLRFQDFGEMMAWQVAAIVLSFEMAEMARGGQCVLEIGWGKREKHFEQF